MLHREPAIVTVLHIGMDFEPELLDVERESLFLVSHVQTDHFDTLTHWASLLCGPMIPPATRRRFSETAVLRSGRWAALTMHAGTRPRPCAAPLARSRMVRGLSPVMSRKVRPKVPRLPQPVWKAI